MGTFLIKPIKIVLLLPDGIGIRNFILTDFIDYLIANGNVLVWHGVPEALVNPYQTQWDGQVTWRSLPTHREGQAAFLLRRAKLIAQLHWQKEPGTDVIIDHMRSRGGSRLYQLGSRGAEVLGRICSTSHPAIVNLDHLHGWSVRQNQYFSFYLDFLKQEQPDVVFCSHQRSERAVPVMLAARQLGIPTATFIYSWDNLPKGRMAVQADYYLVWSEHMKEEMRYYYPDVSPERVLIVGTPQFEHYFNPKLLDSREDFLQRHGLNPDRPVVCFSGDDLTTSPFDPDYLADLAQALRQVPDAQRPQILFRRSPTDVTGRYDAVLAQFPEIGVSEPKWATLANNDWSKVVPTPEDTRLLVNVVAHSDLVVNVGSTMALDFAILNKPAVYLAYNPSSWSPASRWSIERVYRYPHFNHFSRFEPVYWARAREELGSSVLHALANPLELQGARERWVQFLVQTPLNQASRRTADALFQIASQT